MSRVIRNGWACALGCLSLLALASPASASPQVPDVIVYDVGVNGGDTNDIKYWGQSGGIAAYSIATQSCNSGNAEVDWYTSGGSTLHPVIGQNMFRLKSGRFEHVGQSWLKHGFCAVNEVEAFCAPCQSTPCDTLGIGCADTYWADLNDGQDGQSKKQVNAANGSHVHASGPSGNSTIRGRLQVAVTDIDPAQNPGAEYFIEGQYVTADDAQMGASDNNASWRRVNVVSVSNIDGGGPTNRGDPAIYAWQDEDPAVGVQTVKNLEGSAKTTFYLGYKVTDLGGGRWHYEYALQNLNSDQSAGSVSVPIDPQALVTNIGFHDVAYHSGDPYDGTDWPGAKSGGEVRWATTPFSTNANANALRWGTLYNFRFDANVPPVVGSVTIGLFKPSTNTSVIADDIPVPMGAVVSPHTAADSRPVPAPLVAAPGTVSRNGAGVNPVGLVESAPARVGHAWRAALELDGVNRSMLLVSMSGPTEGIFSPLGEVLLLPPVVRLVGGELAFSIPSDPGLVGLGFTAQAVVRRDGGWHLTNALDVVIGASQ